MNHIEMPYTNFIGICLAFCRSHKQQFKLGMWNVQGLHQIQGINNDFRHMYSKIKDSIHDF